MDTELGRLAELYAGLVDDQLLELARTKSELTGVARQALEAEIERRGLTLEVEAEAEPDVAEAEQDSGDAADDPELVELMTFQLAVDAEKALRALDDSEIPVLMEPAMRQLEENGPKIKTSWLTLFVQKPLHQEAKKVLREKMGLFPEMSAEELEGEDAVGGEESLFPLGEFEAGDVPRAEQVLKEAGIWFKATPDDAPGTMTFFEVRFEDLDRAVGVVDAAF